MRIPHSPGRPRQNEIPAERTNLRICAEVRCKIPADITELSAEIVDTICKATRHIPPVIEVKETATKGGIECHIYSRKIRIHPKAATLLVDRPADLAVILCEEFAHIITRQKFHPDSLWETTQTLIDAIADKYGITPEIAISALEYRSYARWLKHRNSKPDRTPSETDRRGSSNPEPRETTQGSAR